MEIDITFSLKRNARVVHMQCDGISHEASLTQNEANINCLNWTVGHIVVSRNDLIESFGGEPVDTFDLAAYERESEPITGPGPGVVDLTDLLAALDETQTRIADLAGNTSAAQWAAPLADTPDRTFADQVMFYTWHDTYHTGQTDLLRQVSGANDRVI
jgi:uncharacterized damage-inducible protein DinB